MTMGLKQVDQFRTKEPPLMGLANGPDGGMMEREESSLPLRHLALEAFVYSFT